MVPPVRVILVLLKIRVLDAEYWFIGFFYKFIEHHLPINAATNIVSAYKGKTWRYDNLFHQYQFICASSV
jgi:hypothetical protein